MDPIDLDWTHLANATNLVRLLGIVIPLVTALVTKRYAESGVKSLVTAGLSVLSGTVVYLLAVDGGYNWAGFLNATMNAYVPAIVTYYGLWKPTAVARKLAAVTPDVGLGTNQHDLDPLADPFVE